MKVENTINEVESSVGLNECLYIRQGKYSVLVSYYGWSEDELTAVMGEEAKGYVVARQEDKRTRHCPAVHCFVNKEQLIAGYKSGRICSIRTAYVDINGDPIWTGDVLQYSVPTLCIVKHGRSRKLECGVCNIGDGNELAPSMATVYAGRLSIEALQGAMWIVRDYMEDYTIFYPSVDSMNTPQFIKDTLE